MPARRRKRPRIYTSPNKVKLIRGGAGYFDALLRMIEQAKECIHFQTYIFDEDDTGKLVANALIAAAKRQVQVYLLVDGYGSETFSKPFSGKLDQAGIQFRYFEPLFKSRHFYFGRRLHHKVVVVDERYALVGGVNVSDKYNDIHGKPAWLDFALLTEGIIAKDLLLICRKVWNGLQPVRKKLQLNSGKISFHIPERENSAVRISRNDWLRHRNQISQTYSEILLHANTEVTILCSYFIPGKKIKRHIQRAVVRGVKVKVILTGISDVSVAKNAELYMYDWLLRNKVDIYEYTKTVLHGKMAICDNEWITLGSYNINDLSAYASIELNLDVKNASFAKHASHTLQDIITNDCVHITHEHLTHHRNALKQFMRWCSYQVVRLMFHLVTFDHK